MSQRNDKELVFIPLVGLYVIQPGPPDTGSNIFTKQSLSLNDGTPDGVDFLLFNRATSFEFSNQFQLEHKTILIKQTNLHIQSPFSSGEQYRFSSTKGLRG